MAMDGQTDNFSSLIPSGSEPTADESPAPKSAGAHSRRRFVMATAGAIAAAGLVAKSHRAAARMAEGGGYFPGEGRSQVKYRWQNVRIGGGGFVTGIITHPTHPIVYARCDVGGAYRLDDQANRWIPITDWVGGPDWPLSGIESLAVDLHHPERVYIAAGMYTNQWAANAVMLRSHDQGKTFIGTPMPFKCGGNEAGRFNGERLVVDPNHPDTLFFGSRLAGLWKSEDASVTWKRVESFDIPNGTEGVGTVFVIFDRQGSHMGRPTPVIYAGVSRPDANMFRSTDAGVTWHPIAGQPKGFRPNHAAIGADGWMYISYGKQPGPNSMTDGAVWKYHTRTGEWRNITPLAPRADHMPFGYGCVAVDLRHPGTVVAGTFCRWDAGDILFRSTDGGEHWTGISQESGGVWDVSSAPWLEFHRIKPNVTNWMGSVQIDPLNSSRVWYTTGWGIFRCNNLEDIDTGGTTEWSFYCNGFEETVINDLASPRAGAHLLSVMGDIAGFRHDNLRESPTNGAYEHACGSNTSISVAALRPEFVVRTFGGQRVNIAYSTTGGRRWNFFPNQPWGAQYGQAEVNCIGSAVLWVPSSGSWNAPDRPVSFTHNGGRSWQASRGIGRGLQVRADQVNSRVFYAFDPYQGKLLGSGNGGASFSVMLSGLPRGKTEVRCAPGCEGELWLASPHGVYGIDARRGRVVRSFEPESAERIGFGKSAAGEDYPAIYMVGKIGGVYGFYRSINGGRTWSRINDFEHQFFAIKTIIGDPRIFGRVYVGTGGRGIIFGDVA